MSPARQSRRERRITELYGKAADQLGNDKAPVRLAGLYALERLAQNNPDHRQTIVNVICAYLRMPYVPPTAYGGDPGLRSGPTSDLGATEEELQVRLAAQSILTGHLRPHLVYRPGQEDDDPPGPTFWEDIEVDLSRAVLVNFDFARCRARLPDFTSAQFYGSTTFSYCRVLALGLDGAVFHGRAFFHNAVIHGGAFFDDTTFHDDVNLSEINFAGDQARFPAAKFHGTVAFHRSDFRGHIRFDGATFHREVSFRHATFHSGVWFGNWTDEAPYATSVACGDAIFHGPVDFDGVSVLDPAGPNVWPSGWQVAANEDVGTTLERTSASTKPVSPLPGLERSDS